MREQEVGLGFGSTNLKSPQALERNRQKYRRKLENKATPPSQRSYALSMLRMTEAAIKESREGCPVHEEDGDDVLDLHPDEWSSKASRG